MIVKKERHALYWFIAIFVLVLVALWGVITSGVLSQILDPDVETSSRSAERFPQVGFG